MSTLLFDIETNGLIPQLDRIHCIVIKDADTGDAIGYADQPGYRPVAEALDRLAEADTIVGHNIIGFDIPAIQKLRPDWKPRGRVRDTLVMARVVWPKDKLIERDYALKAGGAPLPGNLIGAFSLEAFGYRLGEYKGDFKGPWEVWTPEMHEYMMQDGEVTDRLWKRLLRENWSEDSYDLEHEVAEIVSRQERYGFLFDQNGARILLSKLTGRKQEIEIALQESFPPLEIRTPFIPQATNSKFGYVKGVPTEKVTIKTFNPASRDHIAERLKMLGWVPDEMTEGGKPKVDETTLGKVPYPEAAPLAEYLMVEKRLGQLYTGKEAWMLKVNDETGRIHGRVNSNGALTGRMTHSTPNMGQVPSGGSPYGHECRALFTVPEDRLLVGADADALELRCLAHFMARYDNGDYVRVVLEGKKEEGTDIHSVNSRALGLDPKQRYTIGTGTPTGRDIAKVWFYAFIYGAGDEKLGTILGKIGPKTLNHRSGKMEDRTAAAAGKRSRARFLSNLPALGSLTEAVKLTAKTRSVLKGLDGRLLYVRSDHAALNTLLQSAGAIIMKKGLVLLDRSLQREHGLVPGRDYEFVANVHDEWQIEVRAEFAELVGTLAVESIRLAGEAFDFRCPLAGQYQIGKTWADTH